MRKWMNVMLAGTFLFLTAVPFVAAGGGSDKAKGTPLIVYTNSGAEGRQEWLTEEAKAAGFDIEVVSLGAGELANRIIAEKNNPVGDCVFGLNALTWEQLKTEGCLVKWEPVWAKEVDKALSDPEGYYYPLVQVPIFLMYNSAVITPDVAPKDWVDLGSNPIYKDKYVVLGLGGGTSRSLLLNILQRYKDPNGVLKISDQGWNVVKQFIRNGHIEKSGEDILGNMFNGGIPMIQTQITRYMQVTRENPQYKVDIMIPPLGVTCVVEETGILKNSKKFDEAKRFFDWFGSAEIQAKWSEKFGSVPVHPEALKKAAPDIQAFMQRIKPQQMDWTFGAEMMGAWVEKIQLEFVQ